MVKALSDHSRTVAKVRLQAIHSEDLDLVFPTSIETPQDFRNLSRALKPHASALGFPGSFHSLRHWFASYAVTIASNVQVAKLLGRARTSTTTDTYAHLRQSDAARITDAVGEVLRGAAN